MIEIPCSVWQAQDKDHDRNPLLCMASTRQGSWSKSPALYGKNKTRIMIEIPCSSEAAMYQLGEKKTLPPRLNTETFTVDNGPPSTPFNLLLHSKEI